MIQNEEEAWLYHTIKDFEYVVNSGKYGILFFEMLSKDTKVILTNMLNAEANNLKLIRKDDEFAIQEH